MKDLQKTRIEIGSFIMVSLGIYTSVISILWIFLTEIMFISDFGWYTGMTYADYLNSAPRFAEMYIITKKLIGIFLLAMGLLTIIISKNSYSKSEKWSWYALLIAGCTPWMTFIIYKIVIGYIGYSMVTFVIGASLSVIGLAIPAKEILS